MSIHTKVAANNLKDKLSYQLESIVRQTEKNLNTGVVKMPN